MATEPAAAPKAVEGTENASKPLDHEFKIIFRDGGHRLVSVNFVGKSVGDVPLPARAATCFQVKEAASYTMLKNIWMR